MSKYGLIGTSCAGKTTLAHTLTGRLKSYGVLVDGVYSQDRKLTFDVSYLETEMAQNWMVTNLITQEVAMESRSDVNILLSDRTPLDLLAYYAYQFPDSPLFAAMKAYVLEYCKTYAALFYLEPLPYQDDNKRPDDTFRLAVDKCLLDLLREAEEHGINVQRVPRNNVLTYIMQRENIKKPNVKTTLTEADCYALAGMAQRPVLVKQSEQKDSISDTDIWVLYPSTEASFKHKDIIAMARGHFGPYVNLDINLGHVDFVNTFDFPYRIFEPR